MPRIGAARPCGIGYYPVVFGLTAGEFGLVASIVLAIITARYFPTLGQRLVLLVRGGGAATPPPPKER